MWRPLRSGVEVLVHGIVQSDKVGPGTRSRVRRELALDPSDVVAMTVANFRPEKDYPNLLAAARLAIDQDERLVFMVVGQGPLEAQVRAEQRRLGLEGRLHILGHRRDVPDLLAAADLFVLGSRTEGLPVAIMEAMAAGLPVVATAVGGVPEAVSDGVTGRLVPPERPKELAEAILEVGSDAERRRKMGAQGKARSDIFDISVAVERQESVYEDLVLTRRSTPFSPKRTFRPWP